jgi:phage terminase large subunit
MAKQKTATLSQLINPTERQLQFFRTVRDHDFTFYGGAAGGGKSYILRWALVWLLFEVWNSLHISNAVVGLFCEDYPSLWDRQISKIQVEFPAWLGKLKLGNEGRCFQLHDKYGGGTLALRNLDDPSKYLSAEFAAIAVDELTKNPQSVFDFLRLRLRWPGIERPKFIAGSNPGGEGHAWVKKLWIDRDFPMELMPIADQFAFVPALATDNPHLSKSYWAQLNTLPVEMQKIYVQGNWNVFAGQYFDIFDPFRHTKRPEEFGIKPWNTRWIGIDWGFKHNAAAYWNAKVHDSLTATYREFVGNNLSPKQLAERIIELNGSDEIASIWLSPDAFAHRTDTDSIADQMSAVFKAHGLPACSPANDDRVGGWALMYDMLRSGHWVIGSNCTELIKTLPMLSRDENKVEDCVKFEGDDAADAARYGLRSYYRPGEKPLEVRIQERVEPLKANPNDLMVHYHRILSEERKRGTQTVPIRRHWRWAQRATA